MNKLLPKAQTSEIIEQSAGDELLIYDLRLNKAYILNETSKNVYKACDGKTTLEDLRNRYNYTDDLIHFALGELKANNLITDYKGSHFAEINRRNVIKKVGLGSMIALPMIVGIIAPKAIQAQSGVALLGEDCSTRSCAAPNQCTAQFGGTICRAPTGQSCSFSRPDLCVSGCCTASPGGPVCC